MEASSFVKLVFDEPGFFRLEGNSSLARIVGRTIYGGTNRREVDGIISVRFPVHQLAAVKGALGWEARA